MRKLFISFTLVALLIMVPATSAVAEGDITNNISGDVDTQHNTTATADATVGDIYNDNRSYSDGERELKTVNNHGKGYRGFANPAEITYAPLPGYFGKAKRNHNVQSVRDIVMFKDTFTRKQLDSMNADVKCDLGEHFGMIPVEDRKPTDTITVMYVAPDKDTVKQRVLITTRAKTRHTLSVNVLISSMKMAINYGADILFVTAEGAAAELRSSGWGVGLAYTSATISNDETSGGVAAGGMGISGGKAGYASYPWLQTIGLKKK